MSELREWLSTIGELGAAVGTIGAVFVALRLAGRQEQDNKEREDRRQAEKITAWYIPYSGPQPQPGRLFTGMRIKNSSDQVVYDLVAEVVGTQGSFRKTAVGDTPDRNREFGTAVGNVPPGELDTLIDGSGGGMHRRFGIEIAFQDAAGRYWLRQGNGKLEQVAQHPAELFNLSRPISWRYS